MNNRSWAVYPMAMAFTLLAHLPAYAQGTNEVARLETATSVLHEIDRIPEKSIPPALLHHAQGVAVIPNVIKVGFIIGGRTGKGVLVVRRPNGRFSDPVFIRITGGSLGWQAGVQSTDVVLVFNTRRSIEGLMHGTFTLGVGASVAAGPVGRNAEAATNAQLKAEIFSYSRSRGLFAGVALDGSKLDVDQAADAALYGPGLTAEDIIAGRASHVPAAAAGFTREVQAAQSGH